MSGGSYEYSYRKVQDMAEQLQGSKNPLRAAFSRHLFLVADAMKDVEWVDSCDCMPGDENEAIQKVLSVTEDLKILPNVIEQIETLGQQLRKIL